MLLGSEVGKGVAARTTGNALFLRPGMVLLTALAVALPWPAAGQAPRETRGGVGTHVLAGVFAGRIDMEESQRLDALGGRLGLGLGELVQITGFYWKSVDASDRPFLPGNAWGGEAQLNLNAGFGLTPFLVVGAARVEIDTLRKQTALTPGAGLLFPLGPLLLRATVHDYILGISGLRGSDNSNGTTHNWMFSAGLTAAIGRGRSPRTVTIAQEPRPVAVVRSADTTSAGIRNYQSDRRVEVPLPLEGSITIRYGPDAQPIVSFGPSGSSPASASPGTASILNDPTVRSWLRREIAEQLAASGATGGNATLDRVQTERTVQRIVDEVLATMLPRMTAAEAQRTAELRAELQRALGADRSSVASAPGDADSRTRAAEVAPIDVATETTQQPVRVTEPDSESAVGIRASPEAAARLRLALAELAERHADLLTTAETGRGPAVVLRDAAFASGGVLLQPRARAAIADLVRTISLAPRARIRARTY